MNFYERVLVETGRAPAVWALLGFVVTLVVTRGITRRIHRARTRPDGERTRLADVHIGGVHVHHAVWGILLVLVCGLLEFRFRPATPWAEILATLFGIGAALVLDEFALLFHLQDVYWAEEGRSSIDAMLIGAALGTVLLLEASPVGDDNSEQPVATWAYVLLVLLHLATAALCIYKGKLATGLIGVVVPIVATVGAIRLARPGSPWARRRYRGKKAQRMQKRYGERYQQRHEAIRTFIGGRPTALSPDASRETAGS